MRNWIDLTLDWAHWNGAWWNIWIGFIVLRSGDAETASELSGIVQSIGYLIAATGPFIVGVIYDLTHDWNYALILLLVVTLIKFEMGVGVGKDRKV